ncbi:hypothetical protein MBT84_37860 [Streptomyces sp. MBT84]|nr:transposase [Streptomyces sp. MBT84]MBW8705384.1 hypothetical protein [Streptomyces sp. MBT84]
MVRAAALPRSPRQDGSDGVDAASPKIGPGRHRKKPDSVVADKAYSNGPCRQYLRRGGIRHTIPEKTDRQAACLRKGSRSRRSPGIGEDCYKKRNTVERSINRQDADSAAWCPDTRSKCFTPGHALQQGDLLRPELPADHQQLAARVWLDSSATATKSSTVGEGHR